MKTQDPAAIAATIDAFLRDRAHESHVGYWNLRALLLRRLDGLNTAGGSTWAEAQLAYALACEMGLADSGVSFGPLTPLGREVAELLRPWGWGLSGSPDHGHLLNKDGKLAARFRDSALALRVAKLLDADDERAAKTYKTEAGNG